MLQLKIIHFSFPFQKPIQLKIHKRIDGTLHNFCIGKISIKISSKTMEQWTKALDLKPEPITELEDEKQWIEPSQVKQQEPNIKKEDWLEVSKVKQESVTEVDEETDAQLHVHFDNHSQSTLEICDPGFDSHNFCSDNKVCFVKMEAIKPVYTFENEMFQQDPVCKRHSHMQKNNIPNGYTHDDLNCNLNNKILQKSINERVTMKNNGIVFNNLHCALNYEKTSQTIGNEEKIENIKEVNQDLIQTPPLVERPYCCDSCSKTFSDKKMLNYHKRTHTGERPYMCEICDKSFALSSTLSVHKKVHTGQKPHKCEDCDAAFSRKDNLKIHKRSHSVERPYFDCDTCGARMTTKRDLQRHERIHTGEKPHQCHVCGKEFAVKCALTYHVRMHTGERPYKCAECEASFAGKSDLNRHHRIHTGEKPYQCSVCQKCFTVNSTLKSHMRTHTDYKKFKCETCGAGISTKYALQRHEREIHAKSINS